MGLEQEIGVFLMDRGQYMDHWLGRLLGRTPGFRYLGCCDTMRCLELKSRKRPPDVILLDLQTARLLPQGTLPGLRRRCPGSLMLLMDIEDGPQYERLAKHIGADGFVSKADMPRALELIRRRFQSAGS